MKPFLRFALLAPLMIGLSGCLSILGLSTENVPPADRQLPASTQALLAIKGMKQEAPIFVRIFKEESELEVWKLKDGRFQLFRTYPICAWSGGLGPKIAQGDKQAPEGFYTVGRGQMNPHSLYHLAFNIGFPNAYDHANGHTGSALMIHGDCKSVGCYAMTDAYIEEIYILAREAFAAGQTKFHVHAFPFRMTEENMRRHGDTMWSPFWAKLKEGYDSFEASHRPPVVKVCSKQYLVNVQFSGQAGEPAPDGPCPIYAKVDPDQLPGIDGVPQTMFAGLSKPATPAQSTPQAPAVMTASLQQTAPQSRPTPTVASAEMSASPVITKPSATAPTSLASAQGPKAAPSPVHVASATKDEASQPRQAPLRVASVSSAQPVNYQLGTAPFTPPSQTQIAAPQAAPDDLPSKAVDPNAIQKPNRSGKGGKLSASATQQTESQGGGDGNGQAPANGTAGQR